MNEYDSAIVKTLLDENNFEAVNNPEDADILLFNTCAVREKAHEKIHARLSALAYIKKRSKTPRIFGLLGCMAQNLKEELTQEGSVVDLVSGPDNYRELPSLLQELLENPWNKTVRTILSREETYDDLKVSAVYGPLAFVTVMRGCNNFCSFCVVPYTRGRERSRPPESVIREIQRLISEKNIQEVTLLGQNVNSYRHLQTDFSVLAERILNETEIKRLRFTSPHPKDFPDRLLYLMRDFEAFARHIHLPIQSGSTAMLERMKRDYTRDDFFKLTDRIRSIVPDIALSTDIIAGFCDETETEFEETLSALERTEFDSAYMFKYSTRKGTAADRSYEDNVPESVKLERLEKTIALQNSISLKKNQAETGKIFKVLIENTSKRSEADFTGRTSQNKTVIFPVRDGLSPGDFAEVKILAATSASLRGEIHR